MGPFRALKSRLRVTKALQETASRLVVPRPHNLDGQLVVSLTSYPKRFNVLPLTLTCLLRQTIAPNAVILWIGEADCDLLPAAVLGLQSHGLTIKPTKDLRSFTKIVPALQAMPDAYIATADDDVYYPADWLAGLEGAVTDHPKRIAAHRSHRICYRDNGQMASYECWKKNISGMHEGPDIFATGVGGVLYPPGSLHPDVVRGDLFKSLCPHGDDLWLYWMAQRQGSTVRHVGPPPRIIVWPGSQAENLRSINRGIPNENGNDRAIVALTDYFQSN